jgi:hypothetical protein
MTVHEAKDTRRSLSRAALAGLAFIAASVPSYADLVPHYWQERNAAMTMKDDLVDRSPDIHWPQGFHPSKADLFSHNDLLINAI